MKNKVSVVLPVYNVENYLDECLESFLNQSIKDFELIAINDGSTDNSLNILKTYENKFKNLIILDQENKGLSATRNRGIEVATGEYVIFIDSDDMLVPKALEKLYKLSKDNELDITVYDALRVEENTGEEDYGFYDRSKVYKKSLLSKEEFFKGVIKKGMIHAPFHIFKREFLTKHNLRFKEELLHEDELFSMTAYQYINKVGYVNDMLYVRRYRDNSIMSNNIYENEKSLNSYLYILEEFNKLIEKSTNELYTNTVRARASMIMCNLIRYEGFNTKNLLELNSKYKFGLDYIRILYNYVRF